MHTDHGRKVTHSHYNAGERQTQAADLDELEGIVGMRLSTAVRTYVNARRGDVRVITHKNLRYVLTRAAAEIGPDLLVRNLKYRHVEIWMNSISELEPSTRRQYLSVFKVFCRWCIINGYLKSDPTLGYRGPRVKEGLPRELTKADVQAVLGVVPDARGRLIVMLGVHELLRRAEIAGLRREDVDFDQGLLMVVGKGGASAWLPLSVETTEAIVHYFAESPGRTGYVIRSTTRPGDGMSPHAVGVLVSRWMREAGVKERPYDGRSLHAFRHTGIGAILDNGGDVRDARDAARHQNLSTVNVYSRKRRAQTRLREVMGQQTYGEGDNPAA